MDDDPGHPAVLISNRQQVPVDEAGLADLARMTLLAEGVDRCELSVSFVDDEEMSELHRRFMGKEGPTDVLSFPMGDEEGVVPLLGDVVIAPAFASRNNGDLEAELRLLLVHGILHLLGYDHQEDLARGEMWARQERYSGVRAP